MFNRSLLIKLLLLIYLFSTSLSATHLHALVDDDKHEDCPVCILVNSLQSGDIDNSILNITTPIYYLEFESYFNTHIVTKIIKGFNSTAPPLFS